MFKHYLYEALELERPCSHSAECGQPFFVLQPIYPVSSLSLHRPPFSLSLVSHSCDVIVLFNLWVGLWWKRKEETKTLGIKRLHLSEHSVPLLYDWCAITRRGGVWGASKCLDWPRYFQRLSIHLHVTRQAMYV